MWFYAVISCIISNKTIAISGLIEYDVSCGGPAPNTVKVDVLTHNGSVVASSTGLSGNLSVPNAQLWWPYTMNDKQYGYQYTLKV